MAAGAGAKITAQQTSLMTKQRHRHRTEPPRREATRQKDPELGNSGLRIIGHCMKILKQFFFNFCQTILGQKWTKMDKNKTKMDGVTMQPH